MSLDELARLEKAATPGPWDITVATKASGGSSVWTTDGLIMVTSYIETDDARLIAAMRNALPALIAVCEAVRDVKNWPRNPTTDKLRSAVEALDVAQGETRE